MRDFVCSCTHQKKITRTRHATKMEAKNSFFSLEINCTWNESFGLAASSDSLKTGPISWAKQKMKHWVTSFDAFCLPNDDRLLWFNDKTNGLVKNARRYEAIVKIHFFTLSFFTVEFSSFSSLAVISGWILRDGKLRLFLSLPKWKHSRRRFLRCDFFLAFLNIVSAHRAWTFPNDV